MESVARVLVVANRTAATPSLIDAVRERAAAGGCEFTLLVPNATHGLHKLVDPEDQSENEAETTIELAIPLLEEAAGAPVDAMVGGARAAGGDPGRHQPSRLRRDHHLHVADTRLAMAEAGPAEQGGGARPACHNRDGALAGGGEGLNRFWFWTQVAIVVFVVAGMIIALTKI